MIKYPKYKKILFCTDFSENADSAFEYAFGVAKRDESLLYILHVGPSHADTAYIEGTVDGVWPGMSEDLKETIGKELEKNFQEHYVSKTKSISFETAVRYGTPYHEIIKFVGENGIDLIVIGTHGRSGMKRTLFGSVAEMVARMSPVPIFIIPSKERAKLANPDEKPFFPEKTEAPVE